MRWLLLQQLKSKKADSRQKALEKVLKISDDEELAEMLLPLVGDEDASIRKQVYETLEARCRVQDSQVYLKGLRDRSPDVRIACSQALRGFKEPDVISALAKALDDANGSVRHRAAAGLSNFGWTAPDDETSAKQLVAMGKLEAAVDLGSVAVPHLAKAMKEDVYYKRQEAVKCLARISDSGVVKPLIDALRDEESLVRGSAVEALAALADARAVDPLIITLRDKDNNVRAMAVKGLSVLGDKRATEPLCGLLSDSNWDVRLAAIEALGPLGDAKTVEPLIKCLQDRDFSLKPFVEPPEETIADSWEGLIMEAARVADEGEDEEETLVEAEAEPAEMPWEKDEFKPDFSQGTGDDALKKAAAGFAKEVLQPKVEEMLVCSPEGDVLYEWQCADNEKVIELMEFVSQQSRVLTKSMVALGPLEHLEMAQDDVRSVLSIKSECASLVRTRNSPLRDRNLSFS